MPHESDSTEWLVRTLMSMATSVKVVSGDLARGFESNAIYSDDRRRRAFGYAGDPAWVHGVGKRIEAAADILMARLRAQEALAGVPGAAGASPSAGDLLCQAVDDWARHATMPPCEAEPCAICDVTFNRVRVAWKVWSVSSHKPVTDARIMHGALTHRHPDDIGKPVTASSGPAEAGAVPPPGETPKPLNYAMLDPGILETVKALRDAGFNTTDSGDGCSKPAVGRTMDIPHVFAVTTRENIHLEAIRMQDVLGEGWRIEATWSPGESAILVAMKPPARHGEALDALEAALPSPPGERTDSKGKATT